MSDNQPNDSETCPNCTVIHFDDGEPFILKCDACDGAVGFEWPIFNSTLTSPNGETMPWPVYPQVNFDLQQCGWQESDNSKSPGISRTEATNFHQPPSYPKGYDHPTSQLSAGEALPNINRPVAGYPGFLLHPLYAYNGTLPEPPIQQHIDPVALMDQPYSYGYGPLLGFEPYTAPTKPCNSLSPPRPYVTCIPPSRPTSYLPPSPTPTISSQHRPTTSPKQTPTHSGYLNDLSSENKSQQQTPHHFPLPILSNTHPHLHPHSNPHPQLHTHTHPHTNMTINATKTCARTKRSDVLRAQGRCIWCRQVNLTPKYAGCPACREKRAGKVRGYRERKRREEEENSAKAGEV